MAKNYYYIFFKNLFKSWLLYKYTFFIMIKILSTIVLQK